MVLKNCYFFTKHEFHNYRFANNSNFATPHQQPQHRHKKRAIAIWPSVIFDVYYWSCRGFRARYAFALIALLAKLERQTAKGGGRGGLQRTPAPFCSCRRIMSCYRFGGGLLLIYYDRFRERSRAMCANFKFFFRGRSPKFGFGFD